MAKKRPVYGYDVYYRLKTSSSILVAAHNQEEAREEFYKWFDNATKQEILDRFLAALNYNPDIQIMCIDKVDKLTEEDLKGWNN